MRPRRRARRADPTETIGVTTTTDPTGTWHPLDLETQAYQSLLEGHRQDPDDLELYEDMCKARQAMNTRWLEHAVGTVTTPAARVSFGTLTGTITLAAGSYLKILIVRSGIHRRRP